MNIWQAILLGILGVVSYECGQSIGRRLGLDRRVEMWLRKRHWL